MLSTLLVLAVFLVVALVALIVLGVALVAFLGGLAVLVLSIAIGLIIVHRARGTKRMEKSLCDDLF